MPNCPLKHACSGSDTGTSRLLQWIVDLTVPACPNSTRLGLIFMGFRRPQALSDTGAGRSGGGVSGAFVWKTPNWWTNGEDLRLQGSEASKLEATKAKGATKRELMVVDTLISRMIGASLFSGRTEFSVATGS